MAQQFYQIAEIRLEHEYMEDGPFSAIHMGLAPQSQRRFQNLQLLFKPSSSGGSLFCSAPELLENEQEPLFLYFMLKDSLFLNYTELDVDFRPDAQLCLFTAPPEAVSKGQYELRLQVVQLLDQQLITELARGLAARELRISDYSGQSLTDLSGEDELILVEQDSTPPLLYYKTKSPTQQQPFGIMELVPAQLWNSTGQRQGPVIFQIRFKSKRTFWKYILSDRKFEQYKDLTIIDPQNSDMEFREEPFEISSDWKVRSFVAGTALPYQRSSTPRFQLVEKAGTGRFTDKLINRQLPKAVPGQFYQTSSEPKLSVSHIFI